MSAIAMNLNEKLMDETFAERLANAGSLEETRNILSSEGIEMTLEELRRNMEEGKRLLQEKGFLTQDGELSEDALEEVAGGRNWRLIALGAVLGLVSGACGVPEGVIVGAVIIYLGWKY